MSVKTIKGISEEDWMEFKSIAALQGLKAGQMFKSMVKTYKQNQNKFWDSIFGMKKLLSDDDAKEMNNVLKELRKDRGFRV